MKVRLVATLLAMAVVALPVRAADEENPYKNVKVGDYASYKMTTKVAGMDIAGTIVQSVTAKSDKEVTIKAGGKVSFMGKDIDIPEQEQKIDLTKPYDPTKIGGALPAGTDVKVEKGKEGKEKLKIGGKEYDATWTEYKMKAKAMGQDVETDLKVWMSKDAPMGMVKMTMSGDAAGQKIDMTMEMTETGNKK